MMKLNDNTYIIPVTTTLNNLDVDIIIKNSADSEIDNITGIKEPTAQQIGTVKAVPYKEKGPVIYYKVKEVLEIYNLQVVLFRIITDYKEQAFKFEYWTDGTYNYAVWTGYNYKEVNYYDLKEWYKGRYSFIDFLNSLLASLNWNDEGKTFKYKKDSINKFIIIDDVDFKEV